MSPTLKPPSTVLRIFTLARYSSSGPCTSGTSSETDSSMSVTARVKYLATVSGIHTCRRSPSDSFCSSIWYTSSASFSSTYDRGMGRP